jgi:hypothetical protein
MSCCLLIINTPNTLTIKFSNLPNFPGLFSGLLLSALMVYQAAFYQLTIMAQATDSANPDSDVAFTSAVREQITTQRVPAINTNDMLNLPKGQAFAMIEGGQLYKLRLPLPEKEIFIKKSGIPNKLSEMATQMKQSYNSQMSLVDINTPIAPVKKQLDKL